MIPKTEEDGERDEDGVHHGDDGARHRLQHELQPLGARDDAQRAQRAEDAEGAQERDGAARRAVGVNDLHGHVHHGCHLRHGGRAPAPEAAVVGCGRASIF